MNEKLRIGFLVSKTGKLPMWEFEMLQQLLNSDFVTVSVFIATDEKQSLQGSFGYQLFTKFEDWWFRSSPDAFKRVQITEQLQKITILKYDDPAFLYQFQLDIIYSSCLVSADDKIISASRFGIWSINFGAGRYKNLQPPAFWEVMENEPATGSSLEVQLPGNKKIIAVYEGLTLSVPYSVKNNLNSIAWKSSSFLPCRIHELYILGPELFFRKYEDRSVKNQFEIIDKIKYPGSGQMLWLFIRNNLSYVIYRLIAKIRKTRFTILISRQSFTRAIDFSKFKKLELPANKFWADPFIIHNDNHQFLFFEEFDYGTEKAHISVIEIFEDNTHSDPQIVLKRPYHLSYPFVFEFEDDYYMVPESNSNKTVELYKAANFPYEWEFVMNLMENIILIDPTLIYEKGKWWLFGNTQYHPFTSTNDQLLLFYSDNLISNDWTAHPQNPVITDISNCRPAGRIFRQDGILYRPAQNNASQQYGYGLKINRIVILDENEYKEEEVFEINPNKKNNLSAIHSINFTDVLIAVDGIVANS